ncbi:hypothetical protein MLD38_005139 [Melastoma candidum]|uniref:Uncharacterized protein n=1 Tax=Melastoma candidum TaxID=119954 RepID=A0ACB9S9U3_9MYRT|nr:hypothetical protein MLD38_005139 [Melastoma candidum]
MLFSLEPTEISIANSSLHLVLTPLFVLLTFLSPVGAEVKSHTLGSDPVSLRFLESFGFSNTDRVVLSISSLRVSGPSSLLASRAGFFIVPKEAIPGLFLKMQIYPNSCPLDHTGHIIPLLVLQNLSSSAQSSINYTNSVPYPGQFDLYFANCMPPHSRVSMHAHVEFFNVNRHGSRNYLTIGQTELPAIYFASSITCISFLLICIWICLQNHRTVDGALLSMGLFLVMKILAKICSAKTYRCIEQTGLTHGWDMILLLMQFCVVLTFYVMIVTIFKRPLFSKPIATERGKKLVTMLLSILALDNMALVLMERFYPIPNQTGNMADTAPVCSILLLIGTICYVLMLLPIEAAVTLFEEASVEDENAVQDLGKLKWLRKSYLAMGVYFYLCVMFMVGLKLGLNYQHEWVGNAAEDMADFMFYVGVFCLVQLPENRDYLHLTEDAEKIAT